MIDNKKIGSRLEALRKEKKETQTDVAKLLGVQRQVISYYETGARLPNIEDLSILADHYNTTVDYLIGRTETKTIEEDIQMICNYTGLSEAAVNRLINPTKYLDKENRGLISMFIEGDSKNNKALDSVAVMLLVYISEFVKYKARLNFLDDKIENLTIKQAYAIRSRMLKDYRLLKADYHFVLEEFKTIVDSIIVKHFKTPEYNDFIAQFTERLDKQIEELENGKYN